MNVAEALDRGQEELARAGVCGRRRDCAFLLAHATGKDRGWLYLHRDRALTDSQAARFAALIARRALGNPVQYLTGSCEFFGRELRIAPGVYIPKRESETLVEFVLGLLEIPQRADLTWGQSTSKAIIHEVGTGSGAIAIAIASHAPRARIWAGDVSGFAVALARSNARRNGLEGSIGFRHGDLQSPLPGVPDLVVANLPYIAASDLAGLGPEVLTQPRSSLGSGAEGLGHIRQLLANLRIRPGGRVLLEIGSNQAERVSALCARIPGLRYSETVKDLAGLDRVAVIAAD